MKADLSYSLVGLILTTTVLISYASSESRGPESSEYSLSYKAADGRKKYDIARSETSKTCKRRQWPPKDGCDFQCPRNSCTKESHVCIDSIHDCECEDGYEWIGDRCRRKGAGPPRCITGDIMYSEGFYHKSKGCDYVCPENSCTRKKAGSCIHDIHDCRCRRGYTKHGDYCVPLKCEFEGYKFDHREWRDEYCVCYDGDWHCEEASPIPTDTPDPQPGCIGNLPFGLENCVCDGAIAGEAAGIAACGRVLNECSSVISPFGARDNLVDSVQRICDSLALDGCLSASRAVIHNFPGCADVLRNGTPMCSPSQARDLFERSISFSCDPLCPECERLEMR